MSLKIDIIPILFDHLNTLYDDRTKKYSWIEIGLFLGVPSGGAILLALYVSPLMPDTVINTIATVFSIFTALLLSLLMLTYSLSEQIIQSGTSKASQLLRDTIANISFMILISIFTIFDILVLVLLKESQLMSEYLPLFLNILSGLGYFLVFLSGITILMILKRVRALLFSLLIKVGT